MRQVFLHNRGLLRPKEKAFRVSLPVEVERDTSVEKVATKERGSCCSFLGFDAWIVCVLGAG